MTNHPKYVRYSGGGDWSALYIDGKLELANDHYLIDDRISQILGVTEISSDDFELSNGEIAQTLDEICEANSKAARDEIDQEILKHEEAIAELRRRRT